MLKFGNLEFRNLQEQVEENMKDIEKLKSGQAVLDEFGIKVVGEVEAVGDMPTVAEYKEETPDWEYGDAFAVGTTAPYTLYILTRANGEHESDYWFDIGVFPAPGPQGEQGPQGQPGPQGQTGDTGAPGAAAGFGTPTATAYTVGVGTAPSVTIATSGPDTEKVFDFTFYVPVGEAEVTITSSNLTGTLTQPEYNKLDNFDNSIIKFHAGEYLNYILKKWYRNADYLVFIGLSGYETFSTSVYKCVIDRTTRAYTLSVLQPIKVDKGNISTKINSNTNEAAGKVLTADGNGNASWEDPTGATDVVNVTSGTTAGYFSDAEYAKVAGDNCVIVYGNGARYYKKDSETTTTITYIGLYDLSTTSAVYKIEITKSSKYYTLSSSNLSITSSNIKTGSLVAGQFLKSNGSGGSTWGDPPSQVQADWNQTSQSSPAYIKNKPTIPTVPVTDVTVNGTSVLDGTTAKVLVDTVDGTLGGVSGSDWTTITINGSLGTIPAAQVQADWTESDNTKASYIDNKPSLATVATSGSYTDLSNKPTIPAAQVQSDYTQSDNTAVDYIKNKPDLSIYAQSANLATVATTGSYSDLTNTPTIPAAQVNSDWDASSGVSQILNKPSLATVATSGSYNDLSNKPSIPTVSGSYSGDYWTSINLSGTSKSLVAAGALHYQGTVGTSADITWSNLISSTKSVKAGDFWYVKTARILNSPIASVGNLVIATTDGTGSSTTWKVVPTGAGTVTSVRVQATSPVQSSVSTAQTSTLNTTISLADGYGDTKNPYAIKTKNYVLAAPNGINGTPSFRALVKADLPTLTASDVGALPDSTVIPDAVSGTNDGTNWTSLTIGSDTYSIPAGGGTATDVQINGTSIVSSNVANIITEGVYNATTNKIATMSDIPSTSNFVTLDGTQTISGAKTFTNDIELSKKKIYLKDVSTDAFSFIQSNTGKACIATLPLNRTNNPEVPAGITAYDDYGLVIETGGSHGKGWVFDTKSFYCSNSNISGFNLGTSAKKFANLYLSGDISDGTNSLSVANIAAKSTVSGTNDGTNWTALTVDGVTKSIPAGGGPQLYLHKLVFSFISGGQMYYTHVIDYISNSATSLEGGGTISSLSASSFYTAMTEIGAAGNTPPGSPGTTFKPVVEFSGNMYSNYLWITNSSSINAYWIDNITSSGISYSLSGTFGSMSDYYYVTDKVITL